MIQNVCDLIDESLWRFTGAFSPDKTLAGGSPALPAKKGTFAQAFFTCLSNVKTPGTAG
jgi:hypothetical protein